MSNFDFGSIFTSTSSGASGASSVGGLAVPLTASGKNMAALNQQGGAAAVMNPSVSSLIFSKISASAASPGSAATHSKSPSNSIISSSLKSGESASKSSKSPNSSGGRDDKERLKEDKEKTIEFSEPFFINAAAGNFPELTSAADSLLVGHIIIRVPSSGPRQPPCLPHSLMNFILNQNSSSAHRLGSYLFSHCFSDRRKCACKKGCFDHFHLFTHNQLRIKMKTTFNKEFANKSEAAKLVKSESSDGNEFLSADEEIGESAETNSPALGPQSHDTITRSADSASTFISGVEYWLECKQCFKRLSTPHPLSESLFSIAFGRFLASIYYPEKFPDPLNYPQFAHCAHSSTSPSLLLHCFSYPGYQVSFDREDSPVWQILFRRPVSNLEKQETLFNRFVELQTLASLTKQMLDEFSLRVTEFESDRRIAGHENLLDNLRLELNHERSVFFAMFSKLGFKSQAADGTPMMAPTKNLAPPNVGINRDSAILNLNQSDSEQIDVNQLAASVAAVSFLMGSKQQPTTGQIIIDRAVEPTPAIESPTSGLTASLEVHRKLENLKPTASNSPVHNSPAISGLSGNKLAPSSSDMLGAIIGSIQQWNSISVDQFDVYKIQTKMIMKFIGWNQQLNGIHQAINSSGNEIEENKSNAFGSFLKKIGNKNDKPSGAIQIPASLNEKSKQTIVGSSSLPPQSPIAESASLRSRRSSSGGSVHRFTPFVTADDLLDRLPTLPPSSVDVFRGAQYHGHLSLLALNGGICIPVHESEPSSVIAYTLASNRHANLLKDATQSIIQNSSANRTAPLAPTSDTQIEVGEIVNDIGVTMDDENELIRPRARNVENEKSKKIEQPADSANHKHSTLFNTEFSSRPAIIRQLLLSDDSEVLFNLFEDVKTPQFFESDKTAFKCRAFFPIQFHALRSHFLTCGGDYDYIQSLCSSIRWNATGGKSGSTFCKTRDEKFVLKYVPEQELQMFLHVGLRYFKYMDKVVFEGHPSILVNILGVYQVSWRKANGSARQPKIHIFVMPNLFYQRVSNQTIKVFDLKGSERNRYVEQKTNDDTRVLLDTNFLEYIQGLPVTIEADTFERLKVAVHNDSVLLSGLDIVDYSLLVGFNAATKQITVGIIDYVRQYTWDKQIESQIKSLSRIAGGKIPTIIPPPDYKIRFRESIEKYFIPRTRIRGLIEEEDKNNGKNKNNPALKM